MYKIFSSAIAKPISICCISLLFICLTGCKTNQGISHFTASGIPSDNTPWTHTQFDDEQEKFMFAIISDLWGGERPHIYDVALQQVNLLRPEFILSVGDLIDGGTEDINQLHKEWDRFDRRTEEAIAPFFRLGGNHDLTNMVMRKYWVDRYGQRYYHFIYKDVLFLILDSEDYDPVRMQEIYLARAEAIKVMDGPDPSKAVDMEYFKMQERRFGHIGKVQADYFSNVIMQYPKVKYTFLLMHKPVWMNENENGFAKIEATLRNRPYTVINGHYHTYSHTIRKKRDYIMLGTTGGGQNDQSDMAFDHFTLVTMTKEGPSIANIKMAGMLDKTGHIPMGGDTLCYQASLCKKDVSNH